MCLLFYIMNLNKHLRLLYWINDYIFLNFSNYDSKGNCRYISHLIMLDLIKLNNIIGRFEVYINDRKDKENCVYMVEWFKKEMENMDYDYDDFMNWASEQENDKKNKYE